MSFKGKLNVYTCEDCYKRIVTRDVDHGTTPFMITCRSTSGCRGHMRSKMYQVPDGLVETHEWYKPPASQPMSSAERYHFSMGGLFLRNATPPPAGEKG